MPIGMTLHRGGRETRGRGTPGMEDLTGVDPTGSMWHDPEKMVGRGMHGTNGMARAVVETVKKFIRDYVINLRNVGKILEHLQNVRENLKVKEVKLGDYHLGR